MDSQLTQSRSINPIPLCLGVLVVKNRKVKQGMQPKSTLDLGFAAPLRLGVSAVKNISKIRENRVKTGQNRLEKLSRQTLTLDSRHHQGRQNSIESHPQASGAVYWGGADAIHN